MTALRLEKEKNITSHNALHQIALNLACESKSSSDFRFSQVVNCTISATDWPERVENQQFSALKDPNLMIRRQGCYSGFLRKSAQCYSCLIPDLKQSL